MDENQKLLDINQDLESKGINLRIDKRGKELNIPASLPDNKTNDISKLKTIRLKLIALGNSSIFNTQWRTIEGKVFLMGEAYNLIDKKRIVHVICGITDVVNVKSFIEIRPEKLP